MTRLLTLILAYHYFKTTSGSGIELTLLLMVLMSIGLTTAYLVSRVKLQARSTEII